MSDFAATLGIIAAIIGLISSVVSRKKIVENRTIHVVGDSNQPDNRKRWFNYNGFVIFLLFFLYPIGVFGLYKNDRIGVPYKWLWGGLFFIIFLGMIGG